MAIWIRINELHDTPRSLHWILFQLSQPENQSEHVGHLVELNKPALVRVIDVEKQAQLFFGASSCFDPEGNQELSFCASQITVKSKDLQNTRGFSLLVQLCELGNNLRHI